MHFPLRSCEAANSKKSSPKVIMDGKNMMIGKLENYDGRAGAGMEGLPDEGLRNIIFDQQVIFKYLRDV
jgi:hypothetical protein